jgi:hypothetical protein
MRRELVIILGVLVPFAVLLALAFFFFRGAPPPPNDGPSPSQSVEAPRTDVRSPPRAIVVSIVDAGASPRAHQHDVQRLEVRFTPTPDGGFASVKVASSANPWVSACIEDVFDELRFAPTGAETFQPAAFTFVFDPSRD